MSRALSTAPRLVWQAYRNSWSIGWRSSLCSRYCHCWLHSSPAESTESSSHDTTGPTAAQLKAQNQAVMTLLGPQQPSWKHRIKQSWHYWAHSSPAESTVSCGVTLSQLSWKYNIMCLRATADPKAAQMKGKYSALSECHFWPHTAQAESTESRTVKSLKN